MAAMVPPPDEIRRPQWEFWGPEGPPDDFYASRNSIKHFSQDSGLTVRGLKHNIVVGIIVSDNEKPYDWNEEPTPCTAREGRPGYESTDTRLIIFSTKTKRQAKRGGVLWVTINDADSVRFDNSGMFFMKLTH